MASENMNRNNAVHSFPQQRTTLLFFGSTLPFQMPAFLFKGDEGRVSMEALATSNATAATFGPQVACTRQRKAGGNDIRKQCCCPQIQRTTARGDGGRNFAVFGSRDASAVAGGLAARHGISGIDQCGRSRAALDPRSCLAREKRTQIWKRSDDWKDKRNAWRPRMKSEFQNPAQLKVVINGGGFCSTGISKLLSFECRATCNRSFPWKSFDLDRVKRKLSGSPQVGEINAHGLAPSDRIECKLCRALAIFLFSSLVSGTVIDAPLSFAATLVTSSASTEVSELPPVPTEFPPLRDISPPPYERIVLPNGLRVFLLEDHELGLVGGEMLVRGGGTLEPPDKVGLAAISAIVQRSGGSVTHPAETMDSMLEAMAARIEASSSVAQMNVGFRCLTEDLPVVLSLFSEVVQEPLLPANKLELIRSQYLGAIARRPDDAGGIVRREFNKLLYGKDSPYSRVAELPTVKAITRNDLLAFHSKNFRYSLRFPPRSIISDPLQDLNGPEAGLLGIWGDFDAAEVKKLVKASFSSWRPAAQESSSISVAPVAMDSSEAGYGASPSSIYLINVPGLTQGYVRMGELGTTLADPDVFVLDVLNGILNGFGGVLFDEVRSRDGLAYSVSGGWSPAVEHRGAFITAGETRVQAIPQFVQAVRKVLNNVTSEPPDADLLSRAKEKALNSFVFNFADSGAQLARVLTYELFGIDQNFLFKYKEGVEATTAEDVMNAAQVHLHPNSQPVLIVTDARQIMPQLLALNQPVVELEVDYLSQN